jgi:16S rRNA (uracil1498-N3)-methyltransferase
VARTDFSSPRVCVQDALKSGESIVLSANQTNYLLNVLRLREGARVLVFNGRDGEFAASLASPRRKAAALRIDAQLRAQEYPRDIDYLFAPLKHARLDYVAQKAVEMGVRRLCPVITQRTQVARINIDRLRANAQEAAEQCGVIWLAEIVGERPLARILADWPPERVLVFCDEDAPSGSSAAALSARPAPPSISLLIGPEGGFDEEERAMILRAPDVVRLNLGPRILRADTAAVAALALVQAHWGDWR